jgi:hypothetical protein
MKKTYNIADRINEILVPWETVSPDVKLAGMTLLEFKTVVADCATNREALEALRVSIHAAVSARMAADKTARKLIKRVVAGVIADGTLGPDSALYRAMKYVPDSEKATGLIKKPVVSTTAGSSSPSTT